MAIRNCKPEGGAGPGTVRDMDLGEVATFVTTVKLGVVATVGLGGEPQAALVGIAATDRGELVFDTSDSARKFRNVQRTGRVAVVVGGWDEELTYQIEGVADVPAGDELTRCQEAYFVQYSEGRQRAASGSIGYVRVIPTWVRRADFRSEIVETTEATFDQHPM
jgi:pyridoxine/pyridoxamine 5'-phosphate oxidase